MVFLHDLFLSGVRTEILKIMVMQNCLFITKLIWKCNKFLLTKMDKLLTVLLSSKTNPNLDG